MKAWIYWGYIQVNSRCLLSWHAGMPCVTNIQRTILLQTKPVNTEEKRHLYSRNNFKWCGSQRHSIGHLYRRAMVNVRCGSGIHSVVASQLLYSSFFEIAPRLQLAESGPTLWWLPQLTPQGWKGILCVIKRAIFCSNSVSTPLQRITNILCKWSNKNSSKLINITRMENTTHKQGRHFVRLQRFRALLTYMQCLLVHV